MQKPDCIFCKIAKGEIPSAKIWEDSEFLAVLDINPNTKGMALVLTKEHFDSYAFDMPDEEYKRFMVAAKKVSKILEKAFGISRIALVMEGMGINHAHLKLYPLHGVTEKFKEIWAKDRVFFEKYDGFVSTQLGPAANPEDLRALAEQIKKAAGK